MNWKENNPEFAHWISRLKKDPVEILASAGSPIIRYYLFRDVINETDSERYAIAKKNLRNYGERKSLFSQQNAKGFWPVSFPVDGLNEDQIHILTFARQVEVLDELHNFGATVKQEKIQASLVNIMKQMNSEGRFPGTLLHHIHALHVLTIYGLNDNPMASKAYQYLFRAQKPNGGWIDEEQLGKGYEFCIWTSLFALDVLSMIPHYHKREGVQKALRLVCDNLVATDASPLLKSIQAWDNLSTGYQGLGPLHGGTLRVLEILMRLNQPWNRYSKKLINWIEPLQLANGLWPAIARRDKKGDKLVTLRVLKVYKYFSKIYEMQISEDDDNDSNDDNDEFEIAVTLKE